MGGSVYGDDDSLKMGRACGCGLLTKEVGSVAGVEEGEGEEEEEGEWPVKVREKQQLAFSMAVT